MFLSLAGSAVRSMSVRASASFGTWEGRASRACSAESFADVADERTKAGENEKCVSKNCQSSGIAAPGDDTASSKRPGKRYTNVED